MQSKALLNSQRIRQMFEWMVKMWNQGRYRLHFANAREAYNIVKAAEQGETGSPAAYLDYLIPAPANRRIHCSTPWKLVEYSPSYVRIAIEDNAMTELQIADLRFDSIEGALRQVEIQGDGSKFRRIRILANTSATAWQGSVRRDIPVGPWCELDHIS